MGTFKPRPSSPSEPLQSNLNTCQFFLLPLLYRTNATWGLGRISSNTKLGNQDVSALTFSYDYDETAGANSNVFLIGAYTL